jgi:hypothetical protein
MKKANILFVIIALIISSYTYGQADKDINLALKTANINTISKYMITNIELIIGDKEGVYSKSQAIAILNNFYKNNNVKNFNIIHQGGKEGAKYIIGTLKTDKKTYRVYYLLKRQNKKDYIHQLRIENQ